MTVRRFAVLGLVLLSGCAGHEPEPVAPPAPRPVMQPGFTASIPAMPEVGEPFQQGRASYYADRLAGHATASGERYDPRALTAAHPTLPLGSVVDVERRGLVVRVRINDRGPYAKGRILDLSRRAAEELQLIGDGVGDVTLRLVYVPPPRAARR